MCNSALPVSCLFKNLLRNKIVEFLAEDKERERYWTYIRVFWRRCQHPSHHSDCICPLQWKPSIAWQGDADRESMDTLFWLELWSPVIMPWRICHAKQSVTACTVWANWPHSTIRRSFRTWWTESSVQLINDRLSATRILSSRNFNKDQYFGWFTRIRESWVKSLVSLEEWGNEQDAAVLCGSDAEKHQPT